MLTVLLYLSALLTAVGVATSAGWFAYFGGRLLLRYGNGAAARIAGARLVDDPWAGSRTLGVLIVAAFFAGGTVAIRELFVAQQQAQVAGQRIFDQLVGQGESDYTGDGFYTATTALVLAAIGVAVVLAALAQLVAVAEAIVSRRRAYAALVAAGVPRGVLARATVVQSLVAAVPAVLLAVGSGVVVIRVLFGVTVTAGGGTAQSGDGLVIDIPQVVRSVPVPWGYLSASVGVALAAVLLTVGLGLLFLRQATSVEELRAT